MNMKKIYLILLGAGIMAGIAGCERFLDTENLTKRDTSNYPETEGEVSSLLTGVYSAARLMENDPNGRCSFIVSEILSDDRFGGGGPDDATYTNIEKFECDEPNMFEDTWSHAYMAIFRANSLIKSIGMVTYSSDESKDYITGQAYFLRAYCYLYLARMFGTCPLILSTDPVNLPRCSSDSLFAQIGSDLTQAIKLMPSTPMIPERGRATKWAAEALMARAYLFYTGYYKKENMHGADGSTIEGSTVTGYLDDCIANSGLGLYPDFRDLWPYSNEMSKRDGYAYSVNNDLSWVGETGGNYETVFAFQGPAKVTDDNSDEANHIVLYQSIRDQDQAGIFPFGLGWGFGTVNPQLWEDWPDSDLRKKGSICDTSDPDEMPDFQWAGDHQQFETGYIQKKYIAVNVRSGESFVNYSKELYGSVVSDDYQLNNTQDLVEIRFADVLLMDAELKKDAAPINRVRVRAGLEPIAYYSDEALRAERRHELAFEGLRYYDLLRWGIAGEWLNKQNGVAIKNDGASATVQLGDMKAAISRTGGFLPIPQTEIDLSAGVLKQTKGW
jgi:SusD family.